jgi:hypothetical protein
MSLIFVSGVKSGDYNSSLNGENSGHRMLTKLLPGLEDPSVIVMGNAPYHCIFLEKPPTHSWIEDEIITWLQEKGNLFKKGFFKDELLNFAIVNTSSSKR